MKTILQVNKFHYICGGADRYYFNLSELLKKKGHQVVNFSMKDERNEPSEWSDYFVSNIDISKTHFNLSGLKKAARIIYSFEAKKRIEALVKKTKPDIAHIHNIYHQISPSILPVLKKYNIPVAMNLHDYKLVSPNYKFLCRGKLCEHKGSYYKEIIHKSVKNSYIATALCVLEAAIHNFFDIYKKNVDLFIVPCEFAKNKFVEYGFGESQITVVPFTMDVRAYYSYDEQFNRFPQKKDEEYILYFGRLSEEKGIDVLIDAVKNAKSNVKLKITGEGQMLESLKLKVQNERIKNIEFAGFKSGEELKNIIANSLFIVVPSVWYENPASVIYEAMALGKPVLGSRIAGIPELVRDNKTGILFEMGDYKDLSNKIDYMLQNRDLVDTMGKEAKKLADNFRFENHYKEIMEVYNLITHNS